MSTSYQDYENDPKTVYLKTNVDLTLTRTVKGYYIKPGESTGTYIDGEISDYDGDGSNKYIKVTIPYNTLTPTSEWRWHSYFEFPEHTADHGIHGSVETWVIYPLGS